MQVELSVFVPTACFIHADFVEEKFKADTLAEMRKLEDRDESFFRWPEWVKRDKVAWIRNLKSYEQVREMLLTGVPTAVISRQIIDWGEGSGMVDNSIRAYIEHYKATLPKSMIIARRMEKHIEFQKKADAALDTLGEMAKLYHKMNTRIDLVMKKEGALGFLMNNVEKQFTVALDILTRIEQFKGNDLTAAAANGEKVGLTGSSAKVDWNEIYGSKTLNNTMADPASRYRVVKFVEGVNSLFSRMSDEERDKVSQSLKEEMVTSKADPVPSPVPPPSPVSPVAPEPQTMEIDNAQDSRASEIRPIQLPRREPG